MSTSEVFFAGVWLVAAFIIAVHEVGHLLVALATGLHPSEISVGLGPTLLRRRIRSVEVRVRAVPVGGWVSCDELRRGSWATLAFYAAGPLASFLLGLAVVSVAASPYVVDRSAVLDSAVETSTAVVAAPVRAVVSAVHPQHRTTFEPHRTGDAEFVSAIGMVQQSHAAVRFAGPSIAVSLVALVSGALAGFNLLPVFGLDGFGIARELVWLVRRRSRRGADVAAGVVALATCGATTIVAVTLPVLLLRDLVGLIPG